MGSKIMVVLVLLVGLLLVMPVGMCTIEQASQPLEGKKVVYIIYNGMGSPTVTIPKEKLEKNGAEVFLGAESLEPVTTMFGGPTFYPDLTIDEIDPEAYDGIVIAGGEQGGKELLDNTYLLQLLSVFNDEGKTVGGYCWTAQILARADIIQGKRVSAGPDPEVINDIKKAGGIYLPIPGVIKAITSENIVTAFGPLGWNNFGNALVKNLIKTSGGRPQEAYTGDMCLVSL